MSHTRRAAGGRPKAPADGSARDRSSLRRIPGGIWALGLVSLCMDLSSELVHALLPLYMAGALGASMLTIGLVEGVAEATALVVKVFSGVFSDVFRRRKPLVLLGYGLAAITKVVFPLAPTLAWVVGARFVDRVGKGIRGAPRDALIADLAPADLRGASFGLRQALDTVGGVGGPLLALAAMALFAGSFEAAFWVAVVPAGLAVLLLVFGVREPERAAGAGGSRPRVSWRDLRRLPRDYWVVVGIAALLTLARFSEAFLVLRARDLGLSIGEAPWVMVVMSAVYAAVSYPAGTAFDRGHGPRLMMAGLCALVAAHLALGMATAPALVFAGAALWGMHMGLTQGLLAALVAVHAPADLRGSAFGAFNLACGAALLLASALAGALWDASGPRSTFVAGAVFALAAGMALHRHGRAARPGVR